MRRLARLWPAAALFVLFLLALSHPVGAGTFQSMVGSVKVGPVKQVSPLVVPYITWGGDMVTFTQTGSGDKTRKFVCTAGT